MRENSTEPQLVSSKNTTSAGIRILFSLQQLEAEEEARKTIGNVFEHWPISGEEHGKLVDTILRGTREAILSMPAGDNVLHLGFRATIVREHYFDDERSGGGTIERPMDLDEIRMVPTDESSIQNLMEREKIPTGSADGDCPVCMDEFGRDCEAVRMPCSHVFHGDCIKKWLRTSHYCPVCRFEMPTS